MLTFHVTIHARPPGVEAGDTIEVHGRSCRTLAIRADQLAAPLSVSFEQAVAALSMLPRLFCEPDGSFAYFAGDQPDWQIDGHLYDRHGRLVYVELKGRCPSEVFNQLLAVFGWPQIDLIFQLQREGVRVDEAAFRRYCGS